MKQSYRIRKKTLHFAIWMRLLGIVSEDELEKLKRANGMKERNI